MKKVYLIEYWGCYESVDILGVFPSEEEAKIQESVFHNIVRRDLPEKAADEVIRNTGIRGCSFGKLDLTEFYRRGREE